MARYKDLIIWTALLAYLLLGDNHVLLAGKPGKVKVMDHRFYEEILFPGYEYLNAVWDLHASGPYVYIPLCAEAPYNASVHLFRYDTRTGEKKMILDPDRAIGINLNTGVLPQSKFHTAIRTLKDGRLFMVTHNTAAGKYQPYWKLDNLWHDPTGFNSRAFIYDPKTDVVTYLGIPIPNEDIYYGQLDKELNLYYACGMRYRTRSFYVIDLNDMSVTEITDHPVEIAIVVDDDHMVYTNDRKCRIWKWDPFTKKSTMTGLRMPHTPLVSESKGAVTYAWKDEDGWIYAAVQYNNRMCRYKPSEGIMEDLGSGWREDPDGPRKEMIFAPVKARNGKIYYGVLNENAPTYDGAEVIELDPETKKKRNLGTMHLSDGTNANVFGEGALGADGRIYWGDGNHGKRPAMMWAFDPSRVPDDYEPTEEVERVSREAEPMERRYIDTETKNKMWRLRPQVRVLTPFEPLCDTRFKGGRLDTLYLRAAGFPLWNNGVIALSEPYGGYVYGIVGGKDYNLVRVSENTFKLEKLGKIPLKEKMFNGNGVVACSDGIFVTGDDLLKWSGENGFETFRDFENEQIPAAIAKDRKQPWLYVLTEPDNVLVVLNLESRKEMKRFQLYGPVQSRWLVPLKEGGMVGFEGNGGVYKINEDLAMEKVAGHLPSLKGLEFIAEVTSATADDEDVVWGGTREGYLFSVDTEKGMVTNHGKPGPYYLKGVVVKDGRVYSMSGGNFGETHLFIYDANAGFEDRGIVTRKLVNSAVLGDDGKIYIGEYNSSSSILRLSEN